MNNIKFRAWDKLRKRMCEVVKIDFEKGSFALATSSTQNIFKMYYRGTNSETSRAETKKVRFGARKDDVVLMQYTGLRDKNDVEIYEGDIILDALGHINVVEWEKDTARFIGFTINATINTKERKIVYVGRMLVPVKIIGNIHQNPELFNKE